MTRTSERRWAAWYAAVTLFWCYETGWAISRDLAGFAVASTCLAFGFGWLAHATYRRSRTLT